MQRPCVFYFSCPQQITKSLRFHENRYQSHSSELHFTMVDKNVQFKGAQTHQNEGIGLSLQYFTMVEEIFQIKNSEINHNERL